MTAPLHLYALAAQLNGPQWLWPSALWRTLTCSVHSLRHRGDLGQNHFYLSIYLSILSLSFLSTGWPSVNAGIKPHRQSGIPKCPSLRRNSPSVALIQGSSGKQSSPWKTNLLLPTCQSLWYLTTLLLLMSLEWPHSSMEAFTIPDPVTASCVTQPSLSSKTGFSFKSLSISKVQDELTVTALALK